MVVSLFTSFCGVRFSCRPPPAGGDFDIGVKVTMFLWVSSSSSSQILLAAYKSQVESEEALQFLSNWHQYNISSSFSSSPLCTRK